jgi:hypothetical protein
LRMQLNSKSFDILRSQIEADDSKSSKVSNGMTGGTYGKLICFDFSGTSWLVLALGTLHSTKSCVAAPDVLWPRSRSLRLRNRLQNPTQVCGRAAPPKQEAWYRGCFELGGDCSRASISSSKKRVLAWLCFGYAKGMASIVVRLSFLACGLRSRVQRIAR